MCSACICSTSLSMLPMSPAAHPSHAHTVICSWISSSSTRALTGELGTSPSVSSDRFPRSSSMGPVSAWGSWITAEEAVEPGPTRSRFVGRSSSMISVVSSGKSSSELSIFSMEERGESSPGESALAMAAEGACRLASALIDCSRGCDKSLKEIVLRMRNLGGWQTF